MPQKRKRQAARQSSPTAKNRTKPILARPVRQRNIPIATLPERSQLARDRALHALAAMRRDPELSLTHAAKLDGVRRETIKKYFPSALKKTNGKFRATKSDRYTAVLYVPDVHGNSVPVKTHSSREREQLGQYLRDLGRYLRGDRLALSAWHGKKVAGVELVTAGRTITTIEPALSDFHLYRAFNGDSV
jgi:hypothetical protein